MVTDGSGAADVEDPAMVDEEALPIPSRPNRVTAEYVIVGSGTTAYFAVKGIQERDPNAKIIVVVRAFACLFSFSARSCLLVCRHGLRH
jgi:hypothetical protein